MRLNGIALNGGVLNGATPAGGGPPPVTPFPTVLLRPRVTTAANWQAFLAEPTRPYGAPYIAIDTLLLGGSSTGGATAQGLLIVASPIIAPFLVPRLVAAKWDLYFPPPDPYRNLELVLGNPPLFGATTAGGSAQGTLTTTIGLAGVGNAGSAAQVTLTSSSGFAAQGTAGSAAQGVFFLGIQLAAVGMAGGFGSVTLAATLVMAATGFGAGVGAGRLISPVVLPHPAQRITRYPNYNVRRTPWPED